LPWYASPALVDVDNDGDLDLFVGDDTGKLTFFENIGDSANASFAAPIINAFGFGDIGSEAVPTFADLDNDGDLDAFVGRIGGSIRYYENIGSDTDPTFNTSGNDPFGLTDVGESAAPTFFDIDNDGDLDAFVGNLSGQINYFENIGTVDTPNFASVSVNPFGLSQIDSYSQINFVDHDGDGDGDAFISTGDGKTYYSENIGSESDPSFGSAVANPFGISDVISDAKLAFGDLNGDGDLDIIYGDGDGGLGYFENPAEGGGSLDEGSYNITVEVSDGTGNTSSETFTIGVHSNTPTSGADTINGTGADEVFYGSDGDDVIDAAGGSNVIYGGAGNDIPSMAVMEMTSFGVPTHMPTSSTAIPAMTRSQGKEVMTRSMVAPVMT